MYMLILFPKYLTWNKHLINWYFLYIWTLYTNKIKKGSSIFKKSNRKIIFLNSMRKARFCTRSNKKACPKLSFSHVVSKNSVRYTNEKVILSSCGLFKSLFRTCIENNYSISVYYLRLLKKKKKISRTTHINFQKKYTSSSLSSNLTHIIQIYEINFIIGIERILIIVDVIGLVHIIELLWEEVLIVIVVQP